MVSGAPTWIVLARDISDSVTVGGQRRTALAAVLDAETGLVVNVSTGTSIEPVLGRALKSALVSPAPPLAKAVPQRLVVPPELEQAAQAAANGLSWLADTAVTEGSGLDEAEEMMDSLIGHLEGRAQPDDLPAPEDFRILYRELQAYVEASPWKRWSDSDWFAAHLELDGDHVELDCLVLGNAGMQHGFNAVPDAQQLLTASTSPGGDSLNHLDGALMVHLDPWRETPGRFADKARRYGWPSTTRLAPSLTSVHNGDPADLSRSEVRMLALALRGVVSQDARRLTTADKPTVSGELTFHDATVGRYDVSRP
jgi:hypothetical protein